MVNFLEETRRKMDWQNKKLDEKQIEVLFEMLNESLDADLRRIKKVIECCVTAMDSKSVL